MTTKTIWNSQLLFYLHMLMVHMMCSWMRVEHECLLHCLFLDQWFFIMSFFQQLNRQLNPLGLFIFKHQCFACHRQNIDYFFFFILLPRLPRIGEIGIVSEWECISQDEQIMGSESFFFFLKLVKVYMVSGCD